MAAVAVPRAVASLSTPSVRGDVSPTPVLPGLTRFRLPPVNESKK